MFADDEILASFVEETLEHLESIESDLMDVEEGGADADPELVNSVFRAAHSIKGGAAMLGLENIKELAHKLENLLQMVRDQEIVPEPGVVSVLLDGFDMLSSMVDDVSGSHSQDISPIVNRLQGIISSGLAEEDKAMAAETFDAAVEGKPAFKVDYLTLRQAQKGGKHLFILEYDLIHDIHGKYKNPLDFIREIQKSVEIVDIRINLTSAGTLDDDDTPNTLPMCVLMATILEQDFISQLSGLPEDRITPVDTKEMFPDQCASSPLWNEKCGEFTVLGDDNSCMLILPQTITRDMLQAMKKALLDAQGRSDTLRLDMSKLGEIDMLTLQLLYSAQLSYRKTGKELILAGEAPKAVKLKAAQMCFPGIDRPGASLFG